MSREMILEEIRKCICGQIPSRVPCLPLGLDFSRQQAGLGHGQLRRNPEIMLETATNAVEQFGGDWFLLFPDDLIEWEHTGIVVSDDEDHPPAVMEYLSPERSTVKSLRLPDPERDGRMPLHLEGIRKIKRALGKDVCVGSRLAAPLSAASLLLGIEPLMVLVLENPGLVTDFMEYVTRCNEIWARAQVEAGADILWLGDCVASSRFLSLDMFESIALDPACKNAEIIRSAGAVSIYHCAESDLSYLAAASGRSFEIINVGERADLPRLKDSCGARQCFAGGMDPIRFLRDGSVETIEEECKRILDIMAPGGGYIFSTAEGITHDSRPENVRAMIRAIETYRH